MAVTKINGSSKPIVIQNFVVARPPARVQYGISDWRQAIQSAEMQYEPNRVNLYDIYEDIRLDPHLSRQWEKRVENITTLDWDFIDKDGKEVEEMDCIIDSMEFEEIFKEIMLTKAYGISLIELQTVDKIVMGKAEKKLALYSVPRKHLRPEKGVIVKEQYDNQIGASVINYREGQYLNYCAEVGTEKDLGVLSRIAPYVILKKGAVNDWALFVQLFGQPFREYTYNGYDESVRIKLEQSAQDMASAPYIIMPDGAQLKLHEIRNNNTGEVHGKLVDYCDKMISIGILGNTLTTDNGKVGSNALGEVHQQTQAEVFESDKKFITKVLNQRIAPILYNLGFPVVEGKFVPKKEKNLDKVSKKLTILKQVKELGEPIDSDQVYEDADIAKPDNYDQLKADMEEKAAIAQQQKQQQPFGQKSKKKLPIKGNKVLTDDMWSRFRIALADFFDPAP